MSFSGDLNFSHGDIHKHAQEQLAQLTYLRAQPLPGSATVPTVTDAFKDIHSSGALDNLAKQSPQAASRTAFTLPHDGNFDFSHVKPGVVEQRGPASRP